ncbi:MAG: hypothetical protein FRX49_07540 [Trebouxia sp. A1-2]|nr:MAG: hypothetical protein FRX49_07540 [Trebouxia sp. A1-2]
MSAWLSQDFGNGIRLNAKIAVRERGNLETGDKRFLTLFKRRGDAQDLQKNGTLQTSNNQGTAPWDLCISDTLATDSS